MWAICSLFPGCFFLMKLILLPLYLLRISFAYCAWQITQSLAQCLARIRYSDVSLVEMNFQLKKRMLCPPWTNIVHGSSMGSKYKK